MDTAENRVDFPGWEIWKKKIDPAQKIDAEYIIGHSLGANFALINWERNKNTKLILTGPLVPKRNIFSWLFSWIGFLFSEGTSISRKRLATFPHFISGMAQCFLLLSKDSMKIIDVVPKDSLVIIRGKNDKYFFCEDTANSLREKGVRIIEVEDAGHGWNEKFNGIINEIIT
jgi:predicted alpha/beta hydrolase family esterase